MGTKRATDERSPRRRCIVSREERESAEMLRFVVDPDGWIVADVAGKLPGRGFWLSADKDMLHTACAKNLFAKAARARVKVPEDLAERVEQQLVRRCLDHIGLARRAGQAVAGFEKVEAWLKAGKGVGALLAARDGAEQGRAKIVSLQRALAAGSEVVDCLDSGEIGGAFGRDKAVHAVLAKGRLAAKLVMDAGRLKEFRREGSTLGRDERPETQGLKQAGPRDGL